MQNNGIEPGERSRQARAIIALALLFVALAWAWFIGDRGLAYGRHWDEPLVITALENTAESRVLLPHRYYYPSLTHDIAVLSFARELWPAFLADATGQPIDVTGIKESLRGDAALLRLRAVFLSFTVLTGVWTFAISLLWRRSPWEALFAAALISTSWEVGYHARWIAPDGLMMHFGTLTIALLLQALRRPQQRGWLVAATVAAGLTCGSKWTGGIVIVPLLAAAAMCRRDATQGTALARLAGALRRMTVVAFGFGMTVVATTPALLVEPALVFQHIAWEVEHYGSRGFGGYSVNGFGDHLALLAEYLALHVPSPYQWVSAAAAILTLVGLGAAVRSRSRAAVVLLVMPLLFVLYMATQKLMIVRNMLIVVPIGAVLAAAGAGVLHRALARLRFPALPLLVVALVAVNGHWGWNASQSIVHRDSRDEVAELVELMAKTKGHYALSKGIATAMRDRGIEPVSTPVETADWVAFFSQEVDHEQRRAWPANRVDYAQLPGGPWEVNWDYYPTWVGTPRLLLLPRDQFAASQLATVIELEQR